MSKSMTKSKTRPTGRQRALQRLDAALEALCASDPVTRPQRVQAVLGLVPPLMGDEVGVQALYERAARFDRCGGFRDSPWDRPAYLRPRLWAGSFDADPPYPWLEALSTLRLVAVAVGDAAHEDVDGDAARRALERILALNIDKLMEHSTEAARLQRVKHQDAARNLLRFVMAKMPQVDFLHDVAREVDAIMAQRPVWTHHVRATIRLVSMSPGAQASDVPALDRYVEAVLGPTPVSMRFRDPDEYAAALEADEVDLDAEIDGLARSLRGTGLACRQHAVVLRRVADDPERLARALGLDARGTEVLRKHADVVAGLIEETIRPDTAQTAYGLARLLERGLLERPEVVEALRQLGDLELSGDLEELMQASADAGGQLTGAQILLGGTIRVLGQPLGVGQGNNPTCQAARALSLWSQYRPGQLIDVLTQAAQDRDVPMIFEGDVLHSSQLSGGLAPTLDPDLDPVSLVLVPHLDKLYDEMMRRAGGRGDDGHKWVNPALYGDTVPPGFSTCFDPVTWQVRGHDGFVARFAATFHPDHNGGQPPVYAVPVGITITDNRARLLGLHAITLQRVAEDPDGDLRIYFYNPNNEGRQDWGQDICPSVQGHGEEEGESSLPFDQFASRVYAFHHPVHLTGEPADVPRELVERVGRLARKSWGRSYPWP